MVLYSFLRPTHGKRKGQTEGHSGINLGWSEDRNNALWQKGWMARKQGDDMQEKLPSPNACHEKRIKSVIPGAVGRMELWGQLTYGFYLFKFGIGRVARGNER